MSIAQATAHGFHIPNIPVDGMVAMAASNTPTTDAPTLWRTVPLNGLHGWTPEMDNHLKIFDVAVDGTRNRAYVMGIMTAGSKHPTLTRPARSRPKPPTGPKHPTLATSPSAIGRLYVIDRDTYTVEATTDLRPANYYVSPRGAVDTDRGRLYLGYMQRAEVDIYTLDGTSATPTATPTPTPSSSLSWRIYSPLVIKQSHRPWPTPTPTASADVSFRIGDPLPDMPVRPLSGVNAGPTPVGAAGNAGLTSAYQDIGVTMVWYI